MAGYAKSSESYVEAIFLVLPRMQSKRSLRRAEVREYMGELHHPNIIISHVEDTEIPIISLKNGCTVIFLTDLSYSYISVLYLA